MEISEKIRNARAEKGLTQEEAAESLGVSRQTLSHWENGKTYPDIVSVVKMSDLYGVSLDELLKEKPSPSPDGEEGADNLKEQNMNKYLDYLGESTNAANRKVMLAKVILLTTFTIIWAACILSFWLGLGQNAMGYAILTLYMVMPLTIIIVSAIIGGAGLFGRSKWIFCAAFGVMYTMVDYATFDLAHMAKVGSISMPDFIILIAGIIMSATAMGIAALIRYFTKRIND